MRTPSLAWFVTMVVLLLSEGCATTLHDGQTCSAYPVEPGQCRGANGAACDNFLTANQLILDDAHFETLQESWENQGCVVETTNSCLISEVKAELEKLCSVAACTTAQAAKVKTAIANLERLTKTAQLAKPKVNRADIEDQKQKQGEPNENF